jgi:hypothetical protein
MIEVKQLYELPREPVDDAYLCDDVLRFHSYRNGAYYRRAIRFKNVAATRTRVERCTNIGNIVGDFDGLVEVVNSPWRQEVWNDTDESWRDRWEMHHYAIDIEGSFEVIAASWELLPDERGTWREKI